MAKGSIVLKRMENQIGQFREKLKDFDTIVPYYFKLS